MLGCFGEASCWSKLSSEIVGTPSSVPETEEWDKLPQQLLDNVEVKRISIVYPTMRRLQIFSRFAQYSMRYKAWSISRSP
ncbi:hypothetical protein TNCV_2276281 [Trichonephila clavipes]|nr:hypothetical protein TNCV_2276281 [Trichonephila clavipes]